MLLINPYSGRGAPVSGERLVGRSELIDRLVRRVQSEAHCSIIGLARMGKTSVARAVLQKLDTSTTKMNVGYITLDAISGPIQAYTRIIEELPLDEIDDQSITHANDHDEAYEYFRRTFRRRRRVGFKSAIVVDEVDAIIRDDFIDAQLFISRLREVANDRERYGITFIFVSRRSLDMIQGAVDCSTLAGLCEVIYLQPFQRDGLDALADRSPIRVHGSEREALWKLTGGHPFLAEVVMCEAIDRARMHTFDNVEIENAQQAQAHEFTNQYRQVTSLLSHGKMFDSLCELVVGPQWRPIAPHTICLLKHYGILREGDCVSSPLTCTSQHFRDYLVLLSRTMPSWVLLGHAEQQLRHLVQDRMIEEYGKHWFEGLRESLPNLSTALNKLEDQRIREKRLFGDAASDFILDYAYIGDLKDIIFAKWEQYRTVLGGGKGDWERRFQDIMKVRNPMAHHRPVPADVLQEAERSCKVLLSRLPLYQIDEIIGVLTE